MQVPNYHAPEMLIKGLLTRKECVGVKDILKEKKKKTKKLNFFESSN